MEGIFTLANEYRGDGQGLHNRLVPTPGEIVRTNEPRNSTDNAMQLLATVRGNALARSRMHFAATRNDFPLLRGIWHALLLASNNTPG